MGSNRLHIRRFHAHYLAPRYHPAPQRLKGRIDDAVAQHLLAQTLSHALANLFSETDESVWLIRRLELDLAVNAAWDREQLTRVIAAQLARLLAGALNETGDGNVVRFANRAAHLARFLTDVTAAEPGESGITNRLPGCVRCRRWRLCAPQSATSRMPDKQHYSSLTVMS